MKRSPRTISLIGLALAALLSLGCQSTRYRAASMPADLRAKPAAGTGRIQLANLASVSQRSTSINPGDLLDVWVVSGIEEEPPKPHVLQVTSQGSIDLPVIGSVVISGLNPSDASRAIAQAAIDRGVYLRPNITLEVRERATNQVTILGAVAEPGVHEIPVGACNVLAAIAIAGGLTDEAGTEIEVMRQSAGNHFAQATAPEATASEVTQASFNAPPIPGAATGGPLVQRINLAMASSQSTLSQQLGDRDVVMVPPRPDRVIHVTGLVEEPDQFELPADRDVRVLDAISMAGGTSSSVADRVYVVRQLGEGQEPAVIQLSVAKAKKDGKENLILAPGDLVSVESTVATTFVEIVQGFFRVSLGLTSGAFAL